MYQIYYNQENGVFDKLEALMVKYNKNTFAKKNKGHSLHPHNYHYYLLDKNLTFYGCNVYPSENCQTISYDDVINLYNISVNHTEKNFNKDRCAIYIKDSIHLNFIADLCNKYNFTWFGESAIKVKGKICPFYLVILKSGKIDWNTDKWGDDVIGLDQLEDLLLYYSDNLLITIGGNEVKFLPNKSISIGCTTVDFKTIEKIWNKLVK